MGLSVIVKKLRYDPANYCAICGHSKAQHRLTKGRILKDGTVIPPRSFCHVSHCKCPGFVPASNKKQRTKHIGQG